MITLRHIRLFSKELHVCQDILAKKLFYWAELLIRNLGNEADSHTNYIAPNEWVVKNELIRMWKEASICMEELKKTTTNVYQDNLCIGEYSNGGHKVWPIFLVLKSSSVHTFSYRGRAGRLNAVSRMLIRNINISFWENQTEEGKQKDQIKVARLYWEWSEIDGCQEMAEKAEDRPEWAISLKGSLFKP